MAQSAASYGEAVLHKSLTMKHCSVSLHNMKQLHYIPLWSIRFAHMMRKWKNESFPLVIQLYPHYTLAASYILPSTKYASYFAASRKALHKFQSRLDKINTHVFILLPAARTENCYFAARTGSTYELPGFTPLRFLCFGRNSRHFSGTTTMFPCLINFLSSQEFLVK